MANIYPYWEGISIDNAMRHVCQQYNLLEQAAPGKEVRIGETGWPSCGNTIGDAVPSPENAASYFLKFVSWAKAENIDYFYFEAFDEPWKEATEGPQGKCWGIFTSDGVLKPGMQRVFDCETVEADWCEEACDADDPMLRFTFVPEIGSDDWLEGQVCHVDYSGYVIAVFIRVGTGWWTKPYWDRPLTPISADGSWMCDIVTGGNDHLANKIIAFLLPAGYDVPLMRGESSLPASLYEDSIAYMEVERN